MTVKEKVAVWVGLALSVCIVVVGLLTIIRHPHPPQAPLMLTGVILAEDADPQKQAPVAFADVVAQAGASEVHAKADSSGLFHLSVPKPETPKTEITLSISRDGYQPREITGINPSQLLVLKLKPVPTAAAVMPPTRATSVLTNLRVRYSEKASMTTNEGSLVKTFEVVNQANIPCDLKSPCSPDGRWKATVGSTTIESQGGEFRNVRVSCIAGPCPFTKIEGESPIDNGRDLKVSVRNWSDTATFLVEAEVSQTKIIDIVRESFPARFGASMTFTLPASAQGPTIEADMNGQNIVYPLGPALLVSWANCSVKVAADQTKLYRCDLKPGYRFK